MVVETEQTRNVIRSHKEVGKLKLLSFNMFTSSRGKPLPACGCHSYSLNLQCVDWSHAVLHVLERATAYFFVDLGI